VLVSSTSEKETRGKKGQERKDRKKKRSWNLKRYKHGKPIDQDEQGIHQARDYSQGRYTKSASFWAGGIVLKAKQAFFAFLPPFRFTSGFVAIQSPSPSLNDALNNPIYGPS
jgi:hypothetical protein